MVLKGIIIFLSRCKFFQAIIKTLQDSFNYGNFMLQVVHFGFLDILIFYQCTDPLVTFGNFNFYSIKPFIYIINLPRQMRISIIVHAAIYFQDHFFCDAEAVPAGV